MKSWVAPVVAGIVAGGLAFAAGTALSDDDEGSGGAPATVSQATSAVASGQAVFARMSCGGCHTLAAANSRGQFAPNLDERLPRYSRAALKTKIVEPYPGQKPGEQFVDVMPQDFGERLTDDELDTLVSFLLASRGAEAAASP